jgi:hypothetical protein
MPTFAAVVRPLSCFVWGKLRAKTSFSNTLTDTVGVEDEAVAAISDFIRLICSDTAPGTDKSVDRTV